MPIDAYIEEATRSFDHPEILDDFNSFEHKCKPAVSYSSYSTVLVIRALSTYIRRRFDVGLQTRENITKGLIQAFSDSTPIHVIRRDISSFYENIPTEPLIESLLYTTALPAKARRLLEKFFELHCSGPVGLPRGLGLSATLAELALQSFDAAVRAVPGVYRYHRFVDDMILLCTEKAGVSDAVEGLLPTPMRLHPRKRSDLTIANTEGGRDDFAELEYLGYWFRVQQATKKGEPRQVHVGIAEKKINRIKTRLILASRAFLIDDNYFLLLRRFQFLTGNYRFVKRRPLVSTGSSTVRSGIFYNYKLSGVYFGRDFEASAMPELKKLDWFYRNSILGNRYPLGRHLTSRLAGARLENLRTLSFTQGHLRAFNVAVTSSQVEEIKSIWKNV
ncbi:RNA-directed DNA polymerase [Sphingomonas sp. RRHST34]|uniref:RNA-directed DNA polymerase n=1 Tax=Sphingomonas citri TaxID=2862499 RepID=A0ABS7BM90_9SPHN|nr:antiviral reverse transcriptase Drt3a [Sphingomonas citri]MBW6530747.1 RNA-directed DNA polymerase [Sphingomonas citri]